MLVTLIMVLEVQATPSTENIIYYVRFSEDTAIAQGENGSRRVF